MHFLDLTLPTLEANLALDEALLLEAETGRGGEILRLWDWHNHAVVLGAGGKLAEEVDEAACRRDGVIIRRRSSGGGAVLLGPGCLNFALVLSYDRHPALREIGSSYRWILRALSEAFAGLAEDIEPAGTSDLAAAGRKFSGNSQQRKRAFLLHHGTLLYDFEPQRMSRYLRTPPRQPDYRHQRGHADFVTNLRVGAQDLRRRLRAAWAADKPLVSWPSATVGNLVIDKYGLEAWTHRR